MSAAMKRRKAVESINSSTKRLRIDQDPLDHETFQFEDSDEDPLDEDDLDSSSKGTSTPLTTLSSISTPNVPPCRLKTLKCRYPSCPKTFNRPTRLASHLRSHTNTRPFTCTYIGCTKSYIEDKHLKQHIKGTHTHERSHHCDWEDCTKSFLTATRLRRHRAAHEGHERFRCSDYPPCSQTFRKHQTLQRHIRSEHMQLARFPCPWVDSVTGEACDAGFDGSVGLKKHQEREHGVLKNFCMECPSDGTQMGFLTDAQLQKHIKKEHARCLFCDQRFSSQRELQKHVESQHSGTSLQDRKTIPCTYNGCSKTFVKKSNLSVHFRTTHNGERYICGSFDVSETLDLSSWDGEDACGKDFYAKANLEDHIRTAHLGLRSAINSSRNVAGNKSKNKYDPDVFDELLGELPAADLRRTIPCSIPGCEIKFIRTYDLEVHVRTKHDKSNLEDGLDVLIPANEFPVNAIDLGDLLNEDESMGALYEEADIEWEMQRHALEGGAFWIGAEDEALWQSGDQWLDEEREMRALVGDDDPCLARR